MTTRKLSSERLLDDRLIGNMTRRRMPHVLVAFLILFYDFRSADDGAQGVFRRFVYPGAGFGPCGICRAPDLIR